MSYSYEYEWDKEYCYPDSNVLINKLGIKNHDKLVTAEHRDYSLNILQTTQDTKLSSLTLRLMK